MPVNWCEELGTVLANDEVIDGKSERGGYPVIRKNMKQWVLDIPAYAEQLLDGLTRIDWPESTKEMQKNWIGKSVGAYVKFDVENTDKQITVFTTRCDTLFGATYCVLAPEHELVDLITSPEQKEAVEAYKKAAAAKSEIDRTGDNKEKTGVWTGAYAINPVNGNKLPIWISDYVLSTYGTGAIMAVPAHDTRDYAFAKKFNLPIVQVLEGGDITKEAYTEDGLHINSGFLNGMNKEEALNFMFNWLKEHNRGEKRINYKMREWVFARQRYWGEPIPVVHYKDHDELLPESELPLVLPELDDYKPKVNGTAPLENAEEWKKYTNPVTGEVGKRETNTMPGSAASSWYFMRYIDPQNDKEFANQELLAHWMPVDLYVGGPEHAVGHLLYSRFWTHFLHDQGLSPVDEPFKKLVHQGMILGENGEKMSKSRGNVINPDDVVRDYGADTLRVYEMFMGPLQAAKPWATTGLDGAHKFLERVYRLVTDEQYTSRYTTDYDKTLEKIYHQTVKKVTSDYESLNFNTGISQLMIFLNDAYKAEHIYKGFIEGFVKLLSPIAPHLCEEMWQILGHNDTIAYAAWPTYEEALTKDSTVVYAVSVNGKMRDKIEVEADLDQEAVKNLALSSERIKQYTEGHEIVKIIVVPKKIVNIVIK
jgi:leucyl-tRNA synthetase